MRRKAGANGGSIEYEIRAGHRVGEEGIKEEGNLEGVDMHLPLGHTLYRAHKNPKDVQCTLCTYKYLRDVKVFLENVWLEGEH